jgi:hypothetical protein
MQTPNVIVNQQYRLADVLIGVAAQKAIDELVKLGILREMTGQRR